MGVVDVQIDDEDEPDWCTVHDGPRPCQVCLDEAMDRQFEAQRERKGGPNGLF